MENALNHVSDNDFIEFSKAMKAELSKRIHTNHYVSTKADELKKYQSAEQNYKEVSSPKVEDTVADAVDTNVSDIDIGIDTE
jgi:cell fate (sporulation/competence/biofilm development) regulator YmcA (YheA/YmcA/DUF963 family)